MSTTRSIILSAGQGQRLKPLTDDRPKGMVPVAGQTIIERQLKLFRSLGVSDTAIVKGFCASSIPDHGTTHYMNPDFATTNMVCSLFCATGHLDRGPVIVSYGDILYSGSVLRAMLASIGPVSVAVDLDWKGYFGERFDDPYEDAESLVIGPDGLIRSIGQRAPAHSDIQAQYIGLIRFEDAGLKAIRDVRDSVIGTPTEIGWGRPWPKAFMTDLLQELVNRGIPVRAVPIRGQWCEIDSPRDFGLAEKRLGMFTA